MENLAPLIENLPDAENARRFLADFSKKYPGIMRRLEKNAALLADLVTLAAYSPLLATTILQNPDYLWWLDKQRKAKQSRDKIELLESLARFALINSELTANILLARFRRRELLSIYRKDIFNLAATFEITEEISNLADAILEYALNLARQELANRCGSPLEIDDKGRARTAGFVIVALGKLGSRELNYASDIDLLFLYSADGATNGNGSRGSISNREYFVKLSEQITKIVGGQSGEGAAYRVDLRLRPHGRVGALAISVNEAVKYYQTTARMWERQVLIRSRAAAGDTEIFRQFFDAVTDTIFVKTDSVAAALENVRRSKEKINAEKSAADFNVKLGRGGIREIEFIAQALQLAYGGRDHWLRAPHTLISLNRLTERGILTEIELTELSDAYNFLRRVEHRLQMENGLQTHSIPAQADKHQTLARRMLFQNAAAFDSALTSHAEAVSRIFTRIFTTASVQENIHQTDAGEIIVTETALPNKSASSPIFASLEKSGMSAGLPTATRETLERIAAVSPHFSERLAANPFLVGTLPAPQNGFGSETYHKSLITAVENETALAHKLAALRKTWSRFLFQIIAADVFDKITLRETKTNQTALAEAAIAAAIEISRTELEKHFNIALKTFDFAVLGLGKLGGGALDYESDLDLILIYDDEQPAPVKNLTPAEFYQRAVEFFVNALSSLTREGSLYRVDLRLRPDGKNGAMSIGKKAFLNYLENRAAIWEWLAYVKLRAVGGNIELGESAENAARNIIHAKAKNVDQNELRGETFRVRERLEQAKATRRKAKEIDIKFGAGGMLDIYFAVRFLQLRDNVPDDAGNRSTGATLAKLGANDSLSAEHLNNFRNGYDFLSRLDHNLRLTIGRSTRLPLAKRQILQIIVGRMNLASVEDLLEQLTIHRLEIRAAFEDILNISKHPKLFQSPLQHF